MSHVGTPDFMRGLVVLCRVAARSDGDGFALPNDASGDDARAVVSVVLGLADSGAFETPVDPRTVPIFDRFMRTALHVHAAGLSPEDFERSLSVAFAEFLRELRALSPSPPSH